MGYLDIKYYNSSVGSFGAKIKYDSITYYKKPIRSQENVITTMTTERFQELYEKHHHPKYNEAEWVTSDGKRWRVFEDDVVLHGAGYFHWDGTEYWIYVLPYFIKEADRAWVRWAEFTEETVFENVKFGIMEAIEKNDLRDQDPELTVEAHEFWKKKREMYKRWEEEQKRKKQAENSTGNKDKTKKPENTNVVTEPKSQDPKPKPKPKPKPRTDPNLRYKNTNKNSDKVIELETKSKANNNTGKLFKLTMYALAILKKL